MGKNAGIIILGTLGLFYLLTRKGKSNGFGGGGWGYPQYYYSALRTTQGTYGSGSTAKIPEVQAQIEQYHVSKQGRQGAYTRGLPSGSKPPSAAIVSKVPMDFTTTLRDLKMDFMKATQPIPEVQAQIEARRY